MRNPRYLLLGLVLFAAIVAFTDVPPGVVIVGLLMGAVIFKVGLMMLGGLARPVPEPPPPGELRKVKIQYRCSVCGAELRMTLANDEIPDPPKHCLEEMDLVAPIE